MYTMIDNTVNVLAAAILLCAMMVLTVPRVRQLIGTFSIQSMLLALMAGVVGLYAANWHLLVIASLTFLFKVLLIPFLLTKGLKPMELCREPRLRVGIPGTLLLAASLVIISYAVTEPVLMIGETVTHNCLAISVAVTLIGLLVTIARNSPIALIIGLLVMENGVFLGIISVSQGMPLMVEIGMLFDLLVAVMVMGMFVTEIAPASFLEGDAS